MNLLVRYLPRIEMRIPHTWTEHSSEQFIDCLTNSDSSHPHGMALHVVTSFHQVLRSCGGCVTPLIVTL